MALEDILKRIADDARAEADAIAADAAEQVERIMAEARAQADAIATAIEREAAVRAEGQAATELALARLRARDEGLAARHDIVERVLADAQTRLAALDADAYTSLIASRVADVALGGERVLVADADATRLAGLRAAVERHIAEKGHALELDWAHDVADIPAGVLLIGDRTHVEVSPRSLIHSMRDDLAEIAARTLFAEEVDAAS